MPTLVWIGSVFWFGVAAAEPLQDKFLPLGLFKSYTRHTPICQSAAYGCAHDR